MDTEKVRQKIELVLSEYFVLDNVELVSNGDIIEFDMNINNFKFEIEYLVPKNLNSKGTWIVSFSHKITSCEYDGRNFVGTDYSLKRALARAMDSYSKFYNKYIVDANDLYNNYYY